MNTAKAISTNKNQSLLQIAFDGGYYDHAHMTHNFKQIAGANPSTFR